MSITQSFEKLKSEMFIRHRGLLIEKSHGKFIWRNHTFNTIGELDRYIDAAFKSFNNSIK